MKQAVIHTENLRKQYKNTDAYAVDGISVCIRESEIFGILGPNGAGKTTLISMLCGLVKPTEGQFSVFGMDYRRNAAAIKQRIGTVPQEYALYPTLTARENLEYFGSMLGLKGKNLHERIRIALDELGLIRFADRKINTFSGGMKRRINLIAGVLHEPQLLFLDEPTVGVDVQSKNVIMEYLTKLNQNGTTIIYTSHHLSEAENFCSRIAIVEQGRIYAEGTPQELIASVAGARHLEDVFIAITGKELRDVI